MAETLIGGAPHGDVKICFTPDEEIGSGAGLLDLDRLGADFGFTLDGDAFGGVEYETFNAAHAKLRFFGVSVHPGSAKGVMRNAVLMAMEFIAGLPADQRPETTEGYEGYYFAESLIGTVEGAELHCLIRDHDAEKFAARKAFMQSVADGMNAKYGEGAVELTITDSYRNMREKLLPEHQELLDTAREAVRAAGGEPFSNPVAAARTAPRCPSAACRARIWAPAAATTTAVWSIACVEDMDKLRGRSCCLHREALRGKLNTL
jgi:tripeptide aminopeptidase